MMPLSQEPGIPLYVVGVYDALSQQPEVPFYGEQDSNTRREPCVLGAEAFAIFSVLLYLTTCHRRSCTQGGHLSLIHI